MKIRILGGAWLFVIVSNLLLAECKVDSSIWSPSDCYQFNWRDNSTVCIKLSPRKSDQGKMEFGNVSMGQWESVKTSTDTHWDNNQTQNNSKTTKQSDIWVWSTPDWFIQFSQHQWTNHIWILLKAVAIIATIIFITRWCIPLWQMSSTITTTSKLWWFLDVVLPNPWDQEGYLDTISFVEYGIPA